MPHTVIKMKPIKRSVGDQDASRADAAVLAVIRLLARQAAEQDYKAMLEKMPEAANDNQK